MFEIKRVYDEPDDADGVRVLVDRVWPRGLSKERAACDEWEKEVAPSTELRKWFGHDPERFEEFARRYREELDGNAALERIRRLADGAKRVTLVYSASDREHNQAVVLRDVLSA